MIRFAVHVGKKPKRRGKPQLAIVSFRTLSFTHDPTPGKGQNVVRDGEVRVATQLIAVLDIPSPEKPRWTSDRRESAQYIADAIPKARVVAINIPDEKKKGRRGDR